MDTQVLQKSNKPVSDDPVVQGLSKLANQFLRHESGEQSADGQVTVPPCRRELYGLLLVLLKDNESTRDDLPNSTMWRYFCTVSTGKQRT